MVMLYLNCSNESIKKHSNEDTFKTSLINPISQMEIRANKSYSITIINSKGLRMSQANDAIQLGSITPEIDIKIRKLINNNKIIIPIDYFSKDELRIIMDVCKSV